MNADESIPAGADSFPTISAEERPVVAKPQKAMSRVITVIRRGDRHVMSMLINGRLVETEHETHDSAVAAVDEERKKTAEDYE